MADVPVRVLWNTAPWFDPAQIWGAWSFADAPSSPTTYSKPSSGDGLDLGGDPDMRFFLHSVLRDPRVGRVLSWTDDNSTDFGGFSGSYQDRGVIPANQDFYTIQVFHPQGAEADCLFINGFENADIRIFYGSTPSSWTEAVIDSTWNNQLRQADHWSGNISQKFVTFPKARDLFWRVDFHRVTDLPFYGKISSILGGVHYEYEAENEGPGGPDIHGVGQPTGGIFTAQNRADPVFQGQQFVFPFGTDSDLKDFLRMAYRKTHGDPVVVQYYANKFPDLFCTYGVVSSGSRMRIRYIDNQFQLRFTVNELTTNRTVATDYYI